MNDVNDNFNISKIEAYLYSILNGNVSSNTFVGRLPDTIDESWDDMCLIDCSSNIMDEDARGSGLVFISLFARPNNDGTKNVPKMSQLEVALNTCIRSAYDPHYRISRVGTFSDYDSNRNWHYNTVQLNILIF